jgi:hypothetical protein
MTDTMEMVGIRAQAPHGSVLHLLSASKALKLLSPFILLVAFLWVCRVFCWARHCPFSPLQSPPLSFSTQPFNLGTVYLFIVAFLPTGLFHDVVTFFL